MRLLTLAVMLGLAACAPLPPTETPPMEDGPDLCMAARYQSLIGRNRSEIPQAPAGANWRVTCTTCAVTMDYRAERLNIVYDSQSGIVREVKCG